VAGNAIATGRWPLRNLAARTDEDFNDTRAASLKLAAHLRLSGLFVQSLYVNRMIASRI
jgi:hypothetical protein